MAREAKLSICEFTTLPASFDEDLAAYRAAGVRGIGVVEQKIAEDPEAGRKLRESGLAATHCVPAVPSILPQPLFPGPGDPDERVEALCASVRRLAGLDPACVMFLTGPAGERDEAEARRIVREGIAAVAEDGRRAGVPLGLEPIRASQREELSFVHTIPDALALIEEAGAADSVGLFFDTWHLWDAPGVYEHVAAHGGRIVGAHVADRREPTRSSFDRVLPGDGVIPLGPLLRALEEAGYDGWYDVEIFSDNGLFGDGFEDSLWDVPPEELARRARESFLRVWEAR